MRKVLPEKHGALGLEASIKVIDEFIAFLT
jgi:hypothetical protein